MTLAPRIPQGRTSADPLEHAATDGEIMGAFDTGTARRRRAMLGIEPYGFRHAGPAIADSP